MAAESPAPASLSALAHQGDDLTGVLSVRGGQDALTIDTSSLRATVGGKTYPVSTRPVSASRRATMLVVDTSGSMGQAGMATVRTSVAAFLADAPRDVAVGLISFAGTAGVDVAPTTDRAKVQKEVDALKSRGETSLYDAVALAASALSSYDDRSLILLSDGGDTVSHKATKTSATAALRKYGVRAEAVAFKTAESDNSVLTGFAQAGGGSVAAANNTAAVKAAFEAAAKVLDSQVSFTVRPDAGLSSVIPVSITGVAGGRPFEAQSTVDFGAPAPAPVATTAVPVPLDEGAAPARLTAVSESGFTIIAAAAAIFFGLLVLVIAFMAPQLRSGRSKRVETIERYVNPTTSVTMSGNVGSPTNISTNLVNLGEKVMQGRESTSKTMALIEKADLPLRAGEWWVLRIVAVIVSTALVMILLRGGPIMTIISMLLGVGTGIVVPAFVLRFLAKRRCKKFESQLPDVLTLVASSLSTGFSLLQALDAVAKDAAEPAAKEFGRALAETRIGADISESLERMADRTGSANMRWTTMAIRIQREVGGNLAETLRTTAGTLREREALQRHVKALSAEGKLSAYILIALPIGIFLYSMQTNRSYVELLWTKPLGLAMLTAGVISLGVGIFWMRKVVDVEV
ncbi:type II secretion system F family protein [Phycicoccus sp. M110.8]|uniref:type II secretion system F family protein n=1 Tax=Phycicoccus sp. M110.8 TaxID=3075433 RepID=UPI0028FD78B4|nr:type II secretion system F family protein [Phycicoccus sp. M110.8]MDU0312657.1 type II secretion system F family protein [Phycicoccus sp. M110.8]